MIRNLQMMTSLLFPFNVEYCLMKTNSCGNMVWYGIYLRIYYTRNIVYLCMPILYVSYHYNYSNYGLMLFFFSIYLFSNSCNKVFIYM
jgi:hypothetical protein